MPRHIPRLYLEQALEVGIELQPDKLQTHHLINVLRCRENDVVHLFNGQGGEYSARVTTIGKRHISLQTESFIARDSESPVNITLAQGIARGERMDFAIQKAVELGVQVIQPVHTEKSQRLPDDRLHRKMDHWRSVIQSATEQSGRCLLPEICPPVRLDEWLQDTAGTYQTALRLLLDPTSDDTLCQQTKTGQICLLIGPESGLSENEINQAVDQGFAAVRLGPRILRTETAGMAAIAAIQTLWGDYG